MKTIEDIEKIVKNAVSNDCYAVSIEKRVFLGDKLKDENSEIAKAKKNLDDAKTYYDMCCADYLLQTSIGSDQVAIFLSALKTYVRETGEVAFAEWLSLNNMCTFDDVFADTANRVWARLMDLHADYVRARKLANTQKKSAERARAEAKASLANLRAAGLSLDDIIALAKEQ